MTASLYVWWFIVNSVVLLASLFLVFVVLGGASCVGCFGCFLGLVPVGCVWSLCWVLLIAFDCG